MAGPSKEGEKRIFLETGYAGYQSFGGMSAPEFTAQINGVPDEGAESMSREEVGWVLLYKKSAALELGIPDFEWNLPLVYPQFVERLDAVKEMDFHQPPERCPDQGWFLTPDGKGAEA
jgi:hypothetical protein